MNTIVNWFQSQWQHTKNRFSKDPTDSTLPLDQVSRFYQSDFYHSLDESLKSAFYDGALGGLDQRIIPRKDLDTLNDYLKLWKHGRNISCSIYGEKGTGLSTVLNMFQTHLKKDNQLNKLINFDRRICSSIDVINTIGKNLNMDINTKSLDHFIDSINELPATVIMIDNCHLLVQRTLQAQEVLDTLGSIILGSRGHHLWVISCEEQAWRRLCNGYQFNNMFSHKLHVDNFSDSQIRELLLNRIRYAGFNRINDVDINTVKQEKSPLDAIAKKSKGCVELGLFYCLNNLTYGTKQHSLLINPPLEIDMGSFKELSQLELFTLAEICAHGQLTANEHMAVFRLTLNQSKMVLEHLRVLGLLDQEEQANRRDAYSLKLIISAVVIRYLISMNYLY